MDDLSIEQAKAVYRAAIDARVSDAEGPAWWDEVRVELSRVLTAGTLTEAATVIGWWHNDWASVGDTARAAAKRLRQAAVKRTVGCLS